MNNHTDIWYYIIRLKGLCILYIYIFIDLFESESYSIQLWIPLMEFYLLVSRCAAIRFVHFDWEALAGSHHAGPCKTWPREASNRDSLIQLARTVFWFDRVVTNKVSHGATSEIWILHAFRFVDWNTSPLASTSTPREFNVKLLDS